MFPRKLRCRFRRMRAVPMRCGTWRRLFLAHHGEETGAGLERRPRSSRRAHRSSDSRGNAPHGEEPHRCELDDGPALALDTARRLACDCDARRHRRRRRRRAARHRSQVAQHSGRRSRALSARATAAAVSRAAIARASAKGTTSSTGPTAAKRSSATSSRSAASITGSCTKAATGSRRPTTGYSSSRGLTGGASSRTARIVSAETFRRAAADRTRVREQPARLPNEARARLVDHGRDQPLPVAWRDVWTTAKPSRRCSLSSATRQRRKAHA